MGFSLHLHSLELFEITPNPLVFNLNLPSLLECFCELHLACSRRKSRLDRSSIRTGVVGILAPSTTCE
jgi:hypothetical protein